jgi:cytochrome d ubiquinol oxidase subunit II
VGVVVAVILFSGIVAYAVFGGADFGAGFWDLTAGGAERGREPRGLIDHSLAPVWEANHVWLIFCLVVAWTAFPTAFSAVMSTLYVPLGLAALGIVIRGAGFAFRKVAAKTDARRAAGAAFASSSVLTPFFFGTVVGAIASGRVPTAGGGPGVRSWLNPSGLLGGTLAVVTCAYLAAVFLTADAGAGGTTELAAWFRRRAVGSAGVAGVLALCGVFVLRADAPRLFHQLLHPGLPFLAGSGLAGLAALVALRVTSPRVVRMLAVVAVAALVAGWGVGQYPFLLGTHLRIVEAAAPESTLWSVVVVFAAAAVLCVPSLVLLYVLQQRGELEGA